MGVNLDTSRWYHISSANYDELSNSCTHIAQHEHITYPDEAGVMTDCCSNSFG